MKYLHISRLFFSSLLLTGTAVVYAQQDQLAAQPQPSEQPLNDGVTVVERGAIELNEFRVGGRLERVIIKRKSGFNEYYDNQRNDTQWAPVETELGEQQNMRQWKLTGW